MPRYCKQRDNYSCGPVVLLNALKWAGRNPKIFKYSMVKDLRWLCGTTFCGTYDYRLDRALRFLKKNRVWFGNITRPRKITKKRLTDHLKTGGAFIGAYREYGRAREWHYSLFLPHSNTHWKVINYSDGYSLSTKMVVPIKNMYKDLDKNAVWLLTK